MLENRDAMMRLFPEVVAEQSVRPIGHYAESLGQGEGSLDLYAAPTMYQAARTVGRAMREVYQVDGPSLQQHNLDFNASIILDGQIAGGEPRLYLVYSAGNFIEASHETPYLQIGEVKYGNPVLDRMIDDGTGFAEAAKCALISFDSTMRSNVSVGPPVDLAIYRRNSLCLGHRQRIDEDDPYFAKLREAWSGRLRKVFEGIPNPDWPVLGIQSEIGI
jgi:putative proteasome-type protease